MLRLVGGSKTYLLFNNLNQNKTASILLHDPVTVSKIRCDTKLHVNYYTNGPNTQQSKVGGDNKAPPPKE